MALVGFVVVFFVGYLVRVNVCFRGVTQMLHVPLHVLKECYRVTCGNSGALPSWEGLFVVCFLNVL